MGTHVIKYIRDGVNNGFHRREHAGRRIGAARRKERVDGGQEGSQMHVWDRTVCRDREMIIEFGFLKEESRSRCESNVNTIELEKKRV